MAGETPCLAHLMVPFTRGVGRRMVVLVFMAVGFQDFPKSPARVSFFLGLFVTMGGGGSGSLEVRKEAIRMALGSRSMPRKANPCT